MIGNFAPPLLVYWSSITYLQREKIITQIDGNGVPCKPKICHFDHIFSPHETISCRKISVDVVVALKIGHAPAHLGGAIQTTLDGRDLFCTCNAMSRRTQ